MPVRNTENYPDDKIKTSFETTPKMSTYTLAFIVSNFVKRTHPNRNLSLFARPNAIQHTDLASDASQKVLDFMENWTNIPFGINKLDIVVLPNLKSGAMENWGLVTFR